MAVSDRSDPAAALDALGEARERTLTLVSQVCDEDLERVHSPLMSPLVWDLGHIAAFEDLWLVHRLGREPMVRADLAEVYDAFETPRARRGELPFLRPRDARAYMEEVHARAAAVLERRADGDGDGLIAEIVVRHEHQHDETMLQTLELAHLTGFHPAPRAVAATGDTGLELVEIEGGEFTLGAAADGFAYDNERPGHTTVTPDFRIGRTPVTNRAWRQFIADGGYDRRELWSDQGWAWRTEHAITRPEGWTEDLGHRWRLGALTALDPDEPVVHVCWFEADAFARAHGARLPTEAEWERAATWNPRGGGRAAEPAGVHANLDQLSGGPGPVDRRTAQPSGCLAMIGDVWEWTATEFDGYPGFVAHPYREYSEVFFGGGYRVLRGGAWATRARVASATFRNWDYPQRRQIFAGVRIAADA